MTKKLTSAQLMMLNERQGTCIDTYKPFIALRDAGLINASVAPYGRMNWIITEAGEKLLAELVV